MKKIIFSLIIATATLAACTNNSNKSAESQNKSSDVHDISHNNDAGTSSVSDVKHTFSINKIVSQYLQIKNGLANDNGKDAAIAGRAFVESIGEMDLASLTADQRKTWADISDDAKEMAEHIGENPDKLEHQREHFEILSKDMYDLIKSFGAGQVLYKVVDLMYNSGKGAFWLSETKEINNPYMGKAMSNSGTIQEEIK
jgi:hypothetical protein